MARVLVTGIAGFIGSHVAERFIRDGHEVIGIDNFSPYYSKKFKEQNVNAVVASGAVFYERDLVKDDLLDLVHGVTHVVHCAGQPGISDSVSKDDYYLNNVVATKNLLEALKDSKTLCCFVYTSTSSVYGMYANGDETMDTIPISDYGTTKLEAENVIKEYEEKYNMPVSILRLYSVIGPRERPEKLFYKLVDSIMRDKEFSLFRGSDEHVRSYTYVGDIVDGIALALFNPLKSVGEIFNIGGGIAITTGQAIQEVSMLMEKAVKIKLLPKRKGDQEFTRANFDKALRILGYSPKTSFKEAIEQEIKWYLDEIFNK